MGQTGFEAIDLTGVSGVLLDLDNTLYAYQPCHEKAQAAAMALIAKMLPQFSASEIEEAYKKARKTLHTDLDGQAASHSRLLYAQKLIEYLTGRTMPAITLAFEQIYWDTFLPLMQLEPAAVQFLGLCQNLQIPVCLVTDLTAQIQHRKILALGLADQITYMVSSEEAGVEKPDAAMFNLALQKLQLSAHHVIMIGDSASKDVAGAEALGIKAYQITL